MTFLALFDPGYRSWRVSLFWICPSAFGRRLSLSRGRIFLPMASNGRAAPFALHGFGLMLGSVDTAAVGERMTAAKPSGKGGNYEIRL